MIKRNKYERKFPAVTLQSKSNIYFKNPAINIEEKIVNGSKSMLLNLDDTKQIINLWIHASFILKNASLIRNSFNRIVNSGIDPSELPNLHKTSFKSDISKSDLHMKDNNFLVIINFFKYDVPDHYWLKCNNIYFGLKQNVLGVIIFDMSGDHESIKVLDSTHSAK